MKQLFACVVFCLLFLNAISLSLAQQPTLQQAQVTKQEAPAISVGKISGNIYQVKGGAGANSGFFIGKKEVLVIDAKMTRESGNQVVAEIRKVTSNPISHIILTHSDSDHVNGLVGFPQGPSIVSHEKSRIHVDKDFQSAAQRAYLPNITFSERLTLYLPSSSGDTHVDLLYFGPAHTDGDAVVYFPDEKVAFIGDLIFVDREQIIHRHKNGSSSGLVKVLKAILELDAEVFVNGHADVVTKKDIMNHLRSIEEKQLRIESLVKEGKTLEEVKRIFNIKDAPSQSGTAQRPSMVEVIYRELTEKKS
jgi:cyclase